MAYFYRAIAIALLCFCAQAKADTYFQAYALNSESGWFSTKDAAASNLLSVYVGSRGKSYSKCWVNGVEESRESPYNWRIKNGEIAADRWTCGSFMQEFYPGGTETWSISYRTKAVACLPDQELDPVKGICVSPDKCKGLAALCSGMSGSQKSYATYNGDAETFCHTPPDDLFWDQPKYPGCNQGCMAKTGPGTGVTDSTGKTLWKGMGTLTGGLCTNGTPTEPSAPDAPPPAEKSDPVDKRCAGQTGTVNGNTVCIPASSATGVDWTGTTKNSDGTSTEGKTVTTCSNGVCESTTTKTNKDANGQVTGTTTTTDKVSQSEYCAKAKNKDGMLCAAVNANPVPGKDNQSGGPGGGGGGNCTGSNCSDNTAPPGPGQPNFLGTAPPEFGVIYIAKYPDGPVKLWADKSAQLKTSGLATLATNLMPKVGDGGSAPSWSLDFNFGHGLDFGVHTLEPESRIWDIVRAITILCALILARRLVFGG